MLCTFSVNAGLTTLVTMAAIWLPAKESGIIGHSGLPAVAMAIVTIITLDLVTYGAHVALHKFPWLWRIHRVHHSDRFVDATTAFRQHPFEGLWRFSCQLTAILLLGLPLAVVVVYRLASSINSVLEHSNISIGRSIDKAVAWVFITPNMHKAHHSNLPHETDTNYGNLLSAWDRLFSTFTPTERAYALKYGLDSVDPIRAGSIRKLLVMPFSKS
jgi:sterol desaturase/sphingolipid hydroxylase (fatty acid hydroxylase superfamily)